MLNSWLNILELTSQIEISAIKMSSEEDVNLEKAGDVAVAPSKPKMSPPSLYQVILMNDDFTTMDFVVDVLKRYFGLSEEVAAQVMILVHKTGQAVCGVYSKDIAETKAEHVNDYAKESGHPLLCIVKKMD